MVSLENIASQVGPGFLIGFAEGFMISTGVCVIRCVVRLFKKIVQ